MMITSSLCSTCF